MAFSWARLIGTVIFVILFGLVLGFGTGALGLR